MSLNSLKMMRTVFVLIIAVGFCSLAAGQGKKKSKMAATPAFADSLYTAGAYAQAIPVYTKLLKEPANAKSAQMWFRLGASYHNTLDYANAAAAYEASAALGTVPGIHYNLAKVYSVLGKVDLAAARLDSAIQKGKFSNFYVVDSDPEFENFKKSGNYQSIVDKMKALAFPCLGKPEARQFDFWLGEWDVYTYVQPTTPVGYNHITQMASGCVIQENWNALTAPHTGTSINYFDMNTGKWHQRWVASTLNITDFYDGEYKDGAMRFKWDVPNPNGGVLPGRLTFTNIENGKVRQHAEVSNDGGKTWQTSYDLLYIRRK